ncbi:MAG TPA: peptidoglycan-binding protein [Candidatus Paceibacterota bacterium]|nr:peptidoglycan-binding protein [Candidatus Paceibacterota bacterium]
MSIANSNVIAKAAAVVAGLGLVFSSFAYAVPAQAATTAELEAQVAALLAQIQALQGGSSTSTGAAFTTDMTIGASGAEVTRLQNWLISKGHAIPAGATGYFGAQTAAAVAAYQTANGITPAAGYFGPMTRAKVNASLGGSTGGNGGSTGGNTSGDLEGGAGSIDSTDLISGLNNEDVGEDEEDVEVAGLEIEVDDGSDIELTAVRLVFTQTDTNSGGASEDFEDVVSEVSLWLDGEEVARLDGDEFNDDNDFTKTVSLDGGAIIRAGETGELVVGISGVSNIDSSDVDSGWSVDFTQVRFEDADGATISETVTEDARAFNFTTFADAADAALELSLTSGDDADAINDARVIDIDDSDDTDNVELLAFTIEVEGDSEITIDELPVTFVTVGADAEELMSEVRLMLDGEEVGSESFSSSATTTTQVVFDDLDVTLDEGEHEFTIEADLMSDADTNVDNGDTIQVTIAEAQLEAADTEDESGEELAAGDISGSANGDAHGIFEAGIMVEFVSADADVTYTGDVANTNDHDRGTFTITFDVTAFDTDVYVDSSAITVEDGNSLSEQDVDVTGSPTISGVVDTTTGATAGSNGFLVEEDETERFTVTVNVTPAADGFYVVDLEGVLYALTDVDGTLEYTFNMSDYKTPQIYLNYDA